MQWLNNHAQALSALASFGMLLVWIGYLQLFYLSYRRERRVRLLVQQTGGTAVDATCELVNMSGSSVSVVGVLLAASTDEREAVHDLSEIATRTQLRLAKDQQKDIGPPRPRRGPLAPGEAMSLGRFDELLDDGRQAMRDDGSPDDAVLRTLEVRVVFFYRTSDRPLAVRRQFSIDEEQGRTCIAPDSSRTHQLVAWPKRRLAEQWYRQVFG